MTTPAQESVERTPSPTDLERLEAIARAAAEHLPGEWRTDTDDASPSAVAFLDKHAGEERWTGFAHCSGGCMEWVSASAHIATFDPPGVLALLAELAELRAELKAVRAQAQQTATPELKRVEANGVGDNNGFWETEAPSTHGASDER